MVVLPGASGSLSAGMLSMILAELGKGFEIHKVEKIKWSTYAANAQSNMDAVLALFPPEKFYVMSNSFSSRVVCELLAANKFPSRCLGFVFCGYPLYGEKNVPDRVNQLKLIPKRTKLLMISGTLDPLLNREFLPKIGAELLTAIFASLEMPLGQLHFVENGDHDVPKCKGKSAKADTAAGASKVIQLVSDFCV